MENKAKCCNEKKGSQVKRGILYGILPHSFCIAFIALSVIGATTLTTLLKPLLLNEYFFLLLILLSFALATISSLIYLKKSSGISLKSIANNKKYLLTLYSSTILVNLLLFLVVFPWAANISFSNPSLIASTATGLTTKTISVDIPCSGHAPLVMEELKAVSGIVDIKYIPLNKFEISFDPQKTSIDQILSLKIFETFQAEGVN